MSPSRRRGLPPPSGELAAGFPHDSGDGSNSDSPGQFTRELAVQPDFDRINESLQTFANQMFLLPNLPTLNDRQAKIRHKELVKLIKNVDSRLDRLEGRMAVMDERLAVNEHNSMARTLNASVNKAYGRLSPLKSSNNQDVPGFPETLSELLDQTDPQINQLLLSFNLPITGDLPARKRRFQSFIGVGYNV